MNLSSFSILFLSTVFTSSAAISQTLTEEQQAETRIQFANKMVCQTMRYQDRIAGTFDRESCSFGDCESEAELYANAPIETIDTKTIYLRWVVFSDDDGSNLSVSEEQIDEMMTFTNETYEGAKFEFVTFEIVNMSNTEANHADIDVWKEGDYIPTHGSYQDEMFNIFVINDFEGQENGFGTFPFSLSGDGTLVDAGRRGSLVISNGFAAPDATDQEKMILPHEIGHNLGLFHVFEGSFICSEDCHEQIDPDGDGYGLNPYNTGDFLKDTYPHPNMLPYLDDIEAVYADCDFLTTTTFINECSELEYMNLDGLEENIMNYFKCKESFTDEQILRMHCIYNSYYADYGVAASIDEATKNGTEIAIYPNPNNGAFNVTIQTENSVNQTYDLRIYSSSGQMVWKAERFNNPNEVTTLALDLDAGIYWLVSTSENASTKSKFVVQ